MWVVVFILVFGKFIVIDVFKLKLEEFEDVIVCIIISIICGLDLYLIYGFYGSVDE